MYKLQILNYVGSWHTLYFPHESEAREFFELFKGNQSIREIVLSRSDITLEEFIRPVEDVKPHTVFHPGIVHFASLSHSPIAIQAIHGKHCRYYNATENDIEITDVEPGKSWESVKCRYTLRIKTYRGKKVASLHGGGFTSYMAYEPIPGDVVTLDQLRDCIFLGYDEGNPLAMTPSSDLVTGDNVFRQDI